MTFEQYRKLVIDITPNENCPVQNLIEILSRKWNLRVIYELSKKDSARFGELKKQIGKITNTSLSSTLKELEDVGFVSRTQFNEIPPHVEYSLTERGKRLYPIFVAMGAWAKENALDEDFFKM